MDVLQNKMLRPLAGQTRLLEGEAKNGWSGTGPICCA